MYRRIASRAYEIYKENGLLELLNRSRVYVSVRVGDGVDSISKYYYKTKTNHNYNSQGQCIFDEDWDNLIILDASRFDEFERANKLDGILESRTSMGSKTSEFVRGNFVGRKLTDTVVVSDNPWYLRLYDDLDLHYLHRPNRDAFDGAVSHPVTFFKEARDLNRRYPNKKIVFHYLSPHEPYFDLEGEELFSLPSSNPIVIDDYGYSHDDIVEAYRSDLNLTLEYVSELVDDLEGKTVITADHGELLGERIKPIPVRRYSHSELMYVKELVKVPWFTVDYSNRKNIIDDGTNVTNNQIEPDEEVMKQLEKLGYL